MAKNKKGSFKNASIEHRPTKHTSLSFFLLTAQIRDRVQKLDNLAPQQPRARRQAVAAPHQRVAQAPLFQAAVVVEHGQPVDDEQGGLMEGWGVGGWVRRVMRARQRAGGTTARADQTARRQQQNKAVPGTASTASSCGGF